jgi:hypothetical protein
LAARALSYIIPPGLSDQERTVLSPVEIIPSARRVVRRGIEIGCELFSERGGSRRERLFDLSHDGARLSSDVALARGEEVLLSFVPPGAQDDRVSTMCEVVHVADGSPLVGVRFLDLSRPERKAMARRLRGVPPPLPRSRRSSGELVWIDALVTWEEDLGDRLNFFEVSERMIALEDHEIAAASLGSMLTGSAPYVWRA